MNSIQRFYRELAENPSAEALVKLCAYAAAPIFGQIKPAVLVSLTQGWQKEAWRHGREEILRSLGLSARELADGARRTVLFLYDPTLLSRFLSRPGADELLAHFGYDPAAGEHEKLDRLAWRFKIISCPHEVGLFLGYPPEDVAGFVKNCGRRCLCAGHWKVYHDPENALAQFRLIDEARGRMAELLLGKVPADSAARLL